MNEGRSPLVRLLLVAAFLLPALTGSSRAEVGVFVDGPEQRAASGPYVFMITDDSDPIMGIWLEFSPQDSRRVALNPQGDANGDGPPAFSRTAASGDPVVVWSRNSGAGHDIVLSRFVNGQWLGPQVIAGSPHDERDPDLVTGPDGSLHLLYWTDEGSSGTVYHRQATPDLADWSDPVPVSSGGERASFPSGAFHEGDLNVAYQVDPGPGVPKEVALARRVPGGGFALEVLATSFNAGDLRPRAHSADGRFWVDWIDAISGDEEFGDVGWLRRDEQGGWEVTRYESFLGVEEREFHVRGKIRGLALTLP